MIYALPRDVGLFTWHLTAGRVSSVSSAPGTDGKGNAPSMRRGRALGDPLRQLQQLLAQLRRLMHDEWQVARHQKARHVGKVAVLGLEQHTRRRFRERAIASGNLLLHSVQCGLKLDGDL